ncbi:galectin-8-like isoform X2 [Ruditapes philippinarum]|uniref:galectin-8-like isoform X2 n=1 Tax=Ruditapes philippinarum TaxID=129788 RepID=UPI00295AA948|nr:galectin-8-like isoform X2 [Ruditapes philippinarum]
MFSGDQRRNDMNADNHSGLKMLSGAAVQFAGAVLNELGRRSQPPHVPQQSRVMPYIHKTGHLKPNNIIFICGVPRPKATRFTVYLQNGDKFQPSLITFCFDVRFSYGYDRNCIVRNHKDGGWGMEERQIGYFPFKTGEHFEMIILVEQGCFKVAVNDKHMLQFNHRIRQLDRVDTLRIDGDVTLTQEEASRRERCFKIGARVTNLAGSFLGEVSKVAIQADRPVCEKSGFGHSPVTEKVSRRERCFKIGARVTNLAGSFLGEVSKVAIKADRPIGEKSEFGHSPVTEKASRRERCFKIAANVTNLAGSFLSEVDKVIIQADRPIGEKSGFGHSPFTKEMDDFSRPTSPEEFRQSQAPYIKNIHGLHEGKIILVCGIPNSNAKSFSIYLQQGESRDPKFVAMVFDVRFKWGTPVSTNCVVRNHKEGAWDSRQEERSAPCFPFQREKEFQIIILVDRDCFKVAVDDQHFVEFNHRIKTFSCIDTLRIDGDVMISTVQIKE